MIQIRKSPVPDWIRKNQVQKTAEYIAAPKGRKPSVWREDEVVLTLKLECGKKCMYCEGFVDDVSYSAVEHIKPKSLFESLVLEWSNLGLVCPRCNTNKSDYWTNNPDLMLLNPYIDALTDHIEFRGPLTVAILGSKRAANTLRQLKFNSREDLFMARVRRIEDLDVKLRNWYSENNRELKELYAEDVADAITSKQEFSGALRAYALAAGFPIT